MSVTERSNDRLLFLLETVEKEGRHLIGTTARLFAETVDAAWVKRLEDQPELAERTDAFATHFGRMLGSRIDRIPRKDSGSGSRDHHSNPWAFIAGKSHRAHANQASRR